MRKDMEKVAGFVVAICAVWCLSISSLYAEGIVNKQQQSAEYLRTLGRNAATDYADIAVYNPAGIAKMENDGFYLKADLLYFDREYTNDIPDGFGSFAGQTFGEYDQDEGAFIPGLFSIYKQGNWAGYFATTIPAGGGELDFKDGDARMVGIADQIASQFNSALAANGVPSAFYYNRLDGMNVHVKESSVFGYTLGCTYEINDMFAVSLGARYADGKREIEAGTDISATNSFPMPGVNPPIETNLEIDQDADGWAGIVGLNIAPVDKVNIGMIYISRTKMEYENDVKKDTILPGGISLAAAGGFPDGGKQRIDIPALFGAGVSYQVKPNLRFELDYVRYFEDNANIDTYDDEGDTWELSLCAEYRFSPQWMVSVGIGHTEVDLDPDEQIKEPEEPKLDANIIGAGVVYTPVERLSLSFSCLKLWGDSVTDSRGIEYDKDIFGLAFGVQYRFF